MRVDKKKLNAEPRAGQSLLSFLRENGVTGPRRGCDAGDCGCCTVHKDGQAIQSCITPAHQAVDSEITTIAGLAGENLHPTQSDFLQAQGFQCGYCTAGFVMTAAASETMSDDLTNRFKGNFCRCTGYASIKEALSGKCNVEEDTCAQSVGVSLPSHYGKQVITGQQAYTSDFVEPGTLHMKVLRSPHAHAEIVKIDASRALEMDGVIAVFTHEDVPRIPYSTACHPEEIKDPMDTFMLDSVVRFVGQRVACVVAERVDIANEAIKVIDVEYEVLPHILSPDEAMADGAVRIHNAPDETGIARPESNIAAELHDERGDFDAAYQDADYKISATFETPRQQHAHLEPHVATAWVDDAGVLTVRSSTQVPFLAQLTLSKLLGLPADKIRVFKPRVGGGFGNKQEVQVEDLVAFATLKLGRPVHWELTREEEFIATTTRHSTKITMSAACDKAGNLRALGMKYVANTGAYGNHAMDILYCSSFEALAAYRCENKRLEGYSVYTNTVPGGAFRGYGGTQSTFAVESILHDLAEEAGLDPEAFVLKNMTREGEPLNIGNEDAPNHAVSSQKLEACLEFVLQDLKATKDETPALDAEWAVGEGTAVAMLASGIALKHKSEARISKNADGAYTLFAGTSDIGTGSDTSLRQIAADVLGVRVADIDLVVADTQETPFDAGAYASCTTFIAGNAVKRAAGDLKTKLAQTKVSEAGTIVGEGSYYAEKVPMSYAVNGVRLAVNRITGQIRVLHIAQSADIGQRINPQFCKGQVEGATAQALGYCLTEEMILLDDGSVRNAALRDYRIPALSDVPPINSHFVDTEDPHGPFGAKAVGELTINSFPPAFANAVKDALGIRFLSLPLTPTKVWEALNGEAFSKEGLEIYAAPGVHH
ncbi:MAG: molybdopterin-dependent oxidoreductase [Opitutales bacterium]